MINIKFYFSAAVTFRSFDILKQMPDYRPLRLLHTQYERKHIDAVIPYIERGEVEPLFIDSGAYSVHTGKVKENIEEYVDYLNSIDDYTHLCAQFDQIPGKYLKPKVPEDYVYSAQKSWENFLWMYEHMKSPEKLIYVFHQGEDISNLIRALEWRDKNGNKLSVVGLSGQGDSSEKMIRQFMIQTMGIIQRSSNPKCRTHLFGIASDYILNACQPYSSDSTTHVQLGAFGKILIPHYHQPVIVSDRQIPKNKIDIQNITDEELDNLVEDKNGDKFKLQEILPYKGGVEMYQDVKRYIESLNLDMKDVISSPYGRTAVNMHYLQHRFDHIKELNVVTHATPVKLF